MNMTGLVDGGVVPAHITNMKRAFYGCNNLRRIRVEIAAEGSDATNSDTYSTYLRDLVPLNATVNVSAQGGWTSQQIYEGKMMIDPVKMRLPESIVVIWHGTNGYGTDGYALVAQAVYEKIQHWLSFSFAERISN